MPQRFLKPGITNSDRWNTVLFDAQSLYIRILTLVDDYGRCDGRPAVLWGQCFAVWNEKHPKLAINLQQLAGMLQQLAAAKLVEIYTIDGKQVLQVTQWTERIREGCKEKWPANPHLQQPAADCCALLPSPPPSTPSSTPTSSLLSSLPDDLLGMADTWCKWVAFRKELRKPLTPTSAQQQFKKFREWGIPKSIEIVENSIANGWQGLFDKSNGKPSTTGSLFSGKTKEEMMREVLS